MTTEAEGPARWRVGEIEVEGAWAERRRLAAAMRRVIHRLVEIDPPESELASAADALERYADRLDAHPPVMRYEGFAESSNAGNVSAFFDQSPLIGRSNPLSPPVTVRAEGDRVYGAANFGSAYEGPPGHVHGGMIAAAFDEVLGMAQSLSGNPGFTGTLRVLYRTPTPLDTDLSFEGWVVRVEGRKIFTWGELRDGETLCAEAEGIFISFDREKFRAMLERRNRRSGE